jgi:hypothetical protein
VTKIQSTSHEERYEIQGRLKDGSGDGSWHRVCGTTWTDRDRAAMEFAYYMGPMYEGLRRSTDLRLAKVTVDSCITTEVLAP